MIAGWTARHHGEQYGRGANYNNDVGEGNETEALAGDDVDIQPHRGRVLIYMSINDIGDFTISTKEGVEILEELASDWARVGQPGCPY